MPTKDPRPIISSIVEEDAESLCLIGYVHLVLHPLLCETFLRFSSGTICASVAPLAATAIVVISLAHIRIVVLAVAPSVATAIIVPCVALLWVVALSIYQTTY